MRSNTSAASRVGTAMRESTRRQFTACGVTVLLLLCGCSARRPVTSVPSLTEAQGPVSAALTRVRKANDTLAALNVDFDLGVRDLSARMSSVAQKEKYPNATTRIAFAQRMIVTRDEVAQRESQLNGALVEAYRAAAGVPQTYRLAAEASVALNHFAILLRRQSMRSWHTTVPGLVDDPDCVGDLVRDRLLEQYAEGFLQQRAGARQAQFVALVRIARQSACLSARQVTDLGKDTYGAFAELAQLYRGAGRDEVRALLVQMLAQPFVFFYDVDKYRAAGSGWYQWFADNEALLREGLRVNRQPMGWQGLWLYDRRTGRLVRFADADAPRREGEIQLDEFFNSIGRLERLGAGDCSFAEMVLRGPGKAGYSCLTKECRRTDTPPDESRRPFSAKSSFRLSGRLTLSTSTCEGGSGGWDSRPSGARCDQVPQLGPQSRDALAVECVSQQIVRPGLSAMRCISEATGMCASPVDQIAKDLQSTPMAGVKTGKFCGLAQTSGSKAGGQSGGVNVDVLITNVVNAIFEYVKKENAAGRDPDFATMSVQEATDFLLETYQSALEAIESIEEEMDALGEELNSTADPAEQARIEQQLDAKAEELQNAIENANTAEEQLKQLGVDVDKGDEAVPPSDDPDATATARCASEEACNDACSGMENGIRQALACFERIAEPSAPTYRDPIGDCDPEVCDPMEPTGDATLGQCLASDLSTSLDAPKQCWLYRCSRDEVVLAQGAGCACAPSAEIGPGTDPVREFCALALCTGDAGRVAGPAHLSGGSCGCDVIGGSVTSRTEITLNSLTVPGSILNVNPAARDLDTAKLFQFGPVPP